jgi:hypothetical protein
MTMIGEDQVEERVIEIVEQRVDDVTARLVWEVERRALFADAADERLTAALRQAAIAELRAGMLGYKLDRRLPAAPPAETANLARRVAAAGLPLTALVTFYMVALEVYWDVIHDAILSVAASPEIHNAVVRAGTHYLHDYMAQMSGLAAQEYTDERDRGLRRRTVRRLALVRDVLADAGPTDSILRYDLRAEHIGLVATGAAAEEALARLRELDDIRALSVSEGDAIWAWANGTVDELEELERNVLAAAAGSVRIGIGRRQKGAEGFRITHRQARSAHLIAMTVGRTVIRHEEYALAAIAISDPPAARVFIEDELQPLMSEGRRSERLLQTLEVYLDCGQNGTAAAARLGTTARSVSHRVRLIEEALRRPIASRAPELHVALRLRSLRMSAAEARRRLT